MRVLPKRVMAPAVNRLFEGVDAQRHLYVVIHSGGKTTLTVAAFAKGNLRIFLSNFGAQNRSPAQLQIVGT